VRNAKRFNNWEIRRRLAGSGGREKRSLGVDVLNTSSGADHMRLRPIALATGKSPVS